MRRKSRLILLLPALLPAGVASAQTPRLFLVPSGVDPASTTPGSQVPVEGIRGQQLLVDLYLAVSGSALDISGVEVSMPCTSAGGAIYPVAYVPGSAEVFGEELLGCTMNYFDQAAAGSCPTNSPGVLIATPLNSDCPLGGPVRIGSLAYRIPTTIADPNLYVLDPVDVTLTDSNQVPIPGVLMDGLDITICGTCPGVPAVGEWGLVVLLLLISSAATLVILRRQHLEHVTSNMRPR